MSWTIAKCWSPAEVKLLKFAFEYGVEQLGITNNPVVRLAGRNHDHGFTTGHRIVLFYKDTLENVVATLFHELTHVQQFQSGNLKHGKSGALVWKTGETSENTEYDSQPWEIEAYEMEEKLSNSFFKS